LLCRNRKHSPRPEETRPRVLLLETGQAESTVSLAKRKADDVVIRDLGTSETP
jgi:hypothetical protein